MNEATLKQKQLIVYKIEQTTTINPFWFEQYQKLTEKNLKELM